MGSSQSTGKLIDPPDPRKGDPSKGLSISQSEGCDPCNLYVNPGISSSAVTITRDKDPASTKIVINPTIPFEFNFNGEKETVSRLELYHPSPIRIENVQHEAVLVLIGATKSSIYVPIVSGPTPTTLFVSRIATYMRNLTAAQPDKDTKEYEKVQVPTGKDWSLSDIFTKDDSFFTWTMHEWRKEPLQGREALEALRNGYLAYKWVPASTGDKRVIFMQNPITISDSDLRVIQELPMTDPSLPENSIQLDKLFYKAGPPKGCKTCVPIKPPKIDLQAPVSKPGGAGHLSPQTLINIVIGMITGVAGFVAIYFGLRWAISKFGDDFGNTFRGIGIFVYKLIYQFCVAIYQIFKDIFDDGTEKPNLKKESSKFSVINPMFNKKPIAEELPKESVSDLIDKEIPKRSSIIPEKESSIIPKSLTRRNEFEPTPVGQSILPEIKVPNLKKFIPDSESDFIPKSLTRRNPLPSARKMFPPMTRGKEPLAGLPTIEIPKLNKFIPSSDSEFIPKSLTRRNSLPSARSVFGPMKRGKAPIPALPRLPEVELPKISLPTLTPEPKKEEPKKELTDDEKLQKISSPFMRKQIKDIMRNRNLSFDEASTYQKTHGTSGFFRGGEKTRRRTFY